jgi:LAO/AO transport system kinase
MTKESDRQVPVVKTVASHNKGTDELYSYIMMHKEYLEKKGKLEFKRKENLIKQINELVNNRLEHKFWTKDKKDNLESSIDKISKREVTPYDFVDELFKNR